MENSPGTQRESKTFIALPIYGGVDPFFFNSMAALWHKPPFPFEMQMNIGDSLVSRSRNGLTALFLKSTCDQLLFLDCDLKFSPDQIKRIVDHPEGIVGGFYPKKKEEKSEMVCNTFDDVKPPNARGLQKMRYMGTGCLKIRRWVFEVMINKFPEIAFHPDETESGTIHYDFFSVGIHAPSKRYLSEDWFFCQRAIDCGIDIWGDANVVITHRGMVDFPLQSHLANSAMFKYVRTDSIPPVSPPPAPDNVAALPGDSVKGAERSASSLQPLIIPNDKNKLPWNFIMPLEASSDAVKIMDGEYDVPGMKEPPKTILDAGAHVGLFSVWAKWAWPQAKITAFEPLAENAAMYRKNIGENDLIEAALCDHNCETELYVSQGTMESSIAESYNRPTKRTVNAVDASTIGRFDFVKIDTEGAEVPILNKLDLSETKVVVMEAHSEKDRGCAHILLRERGFKCLHDKPSVNGCFLMKFARPEALVI